MDFLIFSIITILIGAGLYILFSLRMSAAIARIKTENPAQKELIEHSLRIVQDMNSYIEEMQEIRSNYYQLVKESRVLIEKLEKASKKASKKISSRPNKDDIESTHSRKGSTEDALDAGDDSDIFLNRVVENLQPDTFETSVQDPIGQRSQPVIDEGNVKKTVDKVTGWIRGFISNPTSDKPVIPRPPERIEPSERVKLPAADLTGTDFGTGAPADADLPASDVEPEDWIRSLVKNGMSPTDVSKLTGRSLAEVELISSLPTLQPSPRRTRIG